MYAEKLAIAVKHNGRVLREHGDTVHLPFGSEFTLHFKNLNSVRAMVRVSIDGQAATEGTSLVIPANGTLDLERFIKNGNLNSGHRFKFIQRTKKIEDGPRGIQVDDGLIRVEFEFEQRAPKIEYETIKRTYVDEYWRRYPIYYGGPYYGTSTIGSSASSIYNMASSTRTVADSANVEVKTSSGIADGMISSASATFSTTSGDMGIAQNAAYVSQTMDSFVPQNVVTDVGITVAGSESNQKFDTVAWFPTDGQKHVMVLKLLGVVGELPVEKPVTVKTKQRCPTCGTTNKSGTKFCRECGTNLSV